MTNLQSKKLGNLLGAAQAEADRKMLELAFIETADCQALLYTSDYSYVVGRRGTGKSAIFHRLKDAFSKDTGTLLITEEPQDFEIIELQKLLSPISSEYRVLRSISRLLWKVHFLLKATTAVSKHYLFSKSAHVGLLSNYIKTHTILCAGPGVSNCLAILKSVQKDASNTEEIPRIIATNYQINQITDALRETLEKTGLRIVALYDRLDEAWTPEVVSISILGGLAKVVADFREMEFPLYPVLLIRDNMFRALAQLEDDFTRHIEGHSLRLHWDTESLLHLVTKRLRIALKLEHIESELKIWNRFAQRELQNRDGFEKCLKYTLFRPRDILVLLNEAYANAQREGREAIVEKDIEKISVNISQNRLDDLCKEYDRVLPGLRLFVASFKGKQALQPLKNIIEQLEYIAEYNDYSDTASRELVLFQNGGEMFSALYSVGFIGIKDNMTDRYTFCHDGTMAALVTLEPNQETLVHPCYWKALDTSVTPESSEILIKLNDEYSAPQTKEPAALRVQRLGRLPEELHDIPLGHLGCHDFESWVLRAVKLLFAGDLSNFALHPNPAEALNQRDIVATNSATAGFWRRIFEDYESRQIIFECKNYEELYPDDFRQILDYSSGGYGKFSIVVRRGITDVLTENEKDRIKALFFEHGRLLMIVPVATFTLCIKKSRTPKEYDYTNHTMSKLLDWYARSVLSLTHMPKYKKKHRK